MAVAVGQGLETQSWGLQARFADPMLLGYRHETPLQIPFKIEARASEHFLEVRRILAAHGTSTKESVHWKEDH